MSFARSTALALSVLLVAACAGPPLAADAPGGRISVDVAPLTLPGVVEATYRLTVRTADGVVWTAGPLASTRYGDGAGSLSYVGPCDASAGPHTVELVLLSLVAEGGVPLASPADFANPTLGPGGAEVPLSLTGVSCAPDADTPVRFELTLSRAAQQGFFDFAISFDSIFCSAKLDCAPALLFDGDGQRGPTAILTFACASDADRPTTLYLSDLTLTCSDADGTTVTSLPVALAPPGQQGPQGNGLFQWAVYQGQEFLAQSTYEKRYWNHAVGLDTAALAGQSCRLTATGAASASPLAIAGGAFVLPQTGSYPFIRWDGEVLTAEGALCENLALDASDGAVATEYVRTDTPAATVPAFAAAFPGGPPVVVACASAAAEVTATATSQGFALSVGDGSVPTATFRLPAGYALAPTCCTPSCCQ